MYVRTLVSQPPKVIRGKGGYYRACIDADKYAFSVAGPRSETLHRVARCSASVVGHGTADKHKRAGESHDRHEHLFPIYLRSVTWRTTMPIIVRSIGNRLWWSGKLHQAVSICQLFRPGSAMRIRTDYSAALPVRQRVVSGRSQFAL